MKITFGEPMPSIFGPICGCDPKKDEDCGGTGCCGGSSMGIIRVSPTRSHTIRDPFGMELPKPKSPGFTPPPWVRGKRK